MNSDLPPPLPVPSSRMFSGGLWLVLLCAAVFLGATAVLLFYLGGWDDLHGGPYRVGTFVGSVSAMFFLPAILALVCWLGSGRRSVVAALVFCGFVPLCLAGYFFTRKGVERVVAQSKMAAVEQKFMEEQRQRVGQDGMNGSTERLDRLQKNLAQAAAGLSGRDQRIAEASTRMLQKMRDQVHVYEVAFNSLNGAGGIDPRTLKRREDIASRRLLSAACGDANEQLATFITGMGARYRAEVSPIASSPQELDRFERGFVDGAHPDLLLQMRETDRQIFAGMNGTLALLDQRWGHWKSNEAGETIFEKRDDVAKFNVLHQQITTAAAEQKALQQQFFQIQSKTGGGVNSP